MSSGPVDALFSRMFATIEKGKKYLKGNQRPPSGKKIYTGTRSGRYYLTEDPHITVGGQHHKLIRGESANEDEKEHIKQKYLTLGAKSVEFLKKPNDEKDVSGNHLHSVYVNWGESTQKDIEARKQGDTGIVHGLQQTLSAFLNRTGKEEQKKPEPVSSPKKTGFRLDGSYQAEATAKKNAAALEKKGYETDIRPKKVGKGTYFSVYFKKKGTGPGQKENLQIKISDDEVQTSPKRFKEVKITEEGVTNRYKIKVKDRADGPDLLTEEEIKQKAIEKHQALKLFNEYFKRPAPVTPLSAEA